MVSNLCNETALYLKDGFVRPCERNGRWEGWHTTFGVSLVQVDGPHPDGARKVTALGVQQPAGTST